MDGRTALMGVAAWLALAPAAAPGAVTVRLEPAAEAGGALPYRPADLEVRNDSPRTIEAARLRWVGGGPGFLYPAEVPPGSRRTLRVALAADSVQQVYDVALLGEGAAVLARRQVEAFWPEQVVDRPSLPVDPQAYLPFEGDLPRWPGAALREAFVTLLVASIVLAALALIPAPLWRAVAALGLVAGATGILAAELLPQSTPVEREFTSPEALEAAGKGASSLVVLSCRRSGVWTADDPHLGPIYRFGYQRMEDQMLVRAGRHLRVPLRPDRLRLFRRMKPR